MKRCARLVTLLVAALVLVLNFDASASAHPVSYPVNNGCAEVLVSSTVVPPGGQLGVAGTNFTPGVHLTIEWHSTVVILGHVTVDANGDFSTTVTVPANAVGNHIITVTGDGEVCPIDPIQVTSHGTGGKHAHRPSRTGVAIASLLILAACLVLVGSVLNASSKKRKRRNHHGSGHGGSGHGGSGRHRQPRHATT